MRNTSRAFVMESRLVCSCSIMWSSSWPLVRKCHETAVEVYKKKGFIISGFGIPAVIHKTACDWEWVGIKSALFKLLLVKFFDDRRVLRKKIRAQGFLCKETRICAVFGCSSSTYQLQRWRTGFCTLHNCHRTSQDCTCAGACFSKDPVNIGPNNLPGRRQGLF